MKKLLTNFLICAVVAGIMLVAFVLIVNKGLDNRCEYYRNNLDMTDAMKELCE